jgi:hypothetical protein
LSSIELAKRTLASFESDRLPLTCGSASDDPAERRGARERDPVPSGAAV